MNLDGATAKVYRQTNTAGVGEMPSYTWSQIYESYFAERTVGMNRYYTAMAHNDNIDMLIEIAPTRALSTASDRVGIPVEYFGESGGESGTEKYFRIVQIQQTEGDDYLPVTLLSLERVEGLE